MFLIGSVLKTFSYWQCFNPNNTSHHQQFSLFGQHKKAYEDPCKLQTQVYPQDSSMSLWTYNFSGISRISQSEALTPRGRQPTVWIFLSEKCLKIKKFWPGRHPYALGSANDFLRWPMHASVWTSHAISIIIRTQSWHIWQLLLTLFFLC